MNACARSIRSSGGKIMFWFEQRVAVPAWAVRVPEWSKSDALSDV
jgi:hypothetical protein